jgi:hypothetical protein
MSISGLFSPPRQRRIFKNTRQPRSVSTDQFAKGIRMTKGNAAMSAIQLLATLGFSLLLLAVSQQANAQQKMDLEARRAAELEARRAQRQKIFNEIQESEKKQLESNVALSESVVTGDSSYWVQRAEQCQEIMLNAKKIPDREKYKNPERIAAIADEAMECLWSLESELRSKGELDRLETCFAQTFEKLPARARAESQHGVLMGEEYVRVGEFMQNAIERKVKNEYGIKNRPLIYLDLMWRAAAEAQSAISYTQLYKMLFFDVGIPKRELNKAEIARYQREKTMAEKRYSPAVLDRANEYLRRMAGPEGDALEAPEQTRSRHAVFSECSPLGPMLGKPLHLLQKQSRWSLTFAAANPIFEKRTENIKKQKDAKAKAYNEKRMAEIREARLQDWRKRLRVDSATNMGIIVAFSSDRTKAQVEMRRCTRYEEIPEEWGCGLAMGVSDKSQCAENNGTGFFTGRSHSVCAEYIVTERSWKNISELNP